MSAGMLTQKHFGIRGYEIVSETIFGQYDASRRPDDSFTCMNIYMYEYLTLSTALYSTGFSFLIICLSCKTHPLADEACDTNCSLGRRMESC